MNNSKEKNIFDLRQIEQLYSKYDSLYSGTVAIKPQSRISTLGLSILDDVEFMLTNPKVRHDFEAEMMSVLQAFAEKILATQTR